MGGCEACGTALLVSNCINEPVSVLGSLLYICCSNSESGETNISGKIRPTVAPRDHALSSIIVQKQKNRTLSHWIYTERRRYKIVQNEDSYLQNLIKS